MRRQKVTILKTGAANLASVIAAFERLGCDTEITTDLEAVADAERLVVPGVGAFDPVVRFLKSTGLDDVLIKRVEAGRTTLAICLGLQILAGSSEEGQGTSGLGLLPVPVRRFPDSVVVPQLGWNTVRTDSTNALLSDGAAYFANSFCIDQIPEGWTVAWANHGGPFVAAIERGAVLGCQFHPELSGSWGEALLKRWLQQSPFRASDRSSTTRETQPARIFHQLPAATGNLLTPILGGRFSQNGSLPAAFAHIGLLDVQSSTTPRPSDRKHHISQHLSGLATKPGEICGLMRRVIPCLDVNLGRVVKGIKFANLRDAGDPVELARTYVEQGADELVLLDVSATPEGRGHALDTVRQVRRVLDIPLTVGGGIREVKDAEALLDAGADKVAVNTAAVTRPELLSELAERFGCQCTVLALDAVAHNGGWRVVVRSGRDHLELDAIKWVDAATKNGAGEILLTSWDRDGTQSGYDLELLKAVSASVAVPVIASGGARTATHMAEAINAGADAVLAASILHDGNTTVKTLKAQLKTLDVEVRT